MIIKSIKHLLDYYKDKELFIDYNKDQHKYLMKIIVENDIFIDIIVNYIKSKNKKIYKPALLMMISLSYDYSEELSSLIISKNIITILRVSFNTNHKKDSLLLDLLINLSCYS